MNTIVKDPNGPKLTQTDNNQAHVYSDTKN